MMEEIRSAPFRPTRSCSPWSAAWRALRAAGLRLCRPRPARGCLVAAVSAELGPSPPGTRGRRGHTDRAQRPGPARWPPAPARHRAARAPGADRRALRRRLLLCPYGGRGVAERRAGRVGGVLPDAHRPGAAWHRGQPGRPPGEADSAVDPAAPGCPTGPRCSTAGWERVRAGPPLFAELQPGAAGRGAAGGHRPGRPRGAGPAAARRSRRDPARAPAARLRLRLRRRRVRHRAARDRRRRRAPVGARGSRERLAERTSAGIVGLSPSRGHDAGRSLRAGRGGAPARAGPERRADRRSPSSRPISVFREPGRSDRAPPGSPPGSRNAGAGRSRSSRRRRCRSARPS